MTVDRWAYFEWVFLSIAICNLYLVNVFLLRRESYNFGDYQLSPQWLGTIRSQIKWKFISKIGISNIMSFASVWSQK